MPDQEILREIKRVLELTSRIDERVHSIVESHSKMADRFDKFIDQHSLLVERVVRLEGNTWSGEKIENHLNLIQEEHKKTMNRIITIESGTPYALKIVDQSLEALNKLTDRVRKVEDEQQNQGKTVSSWQGWLSWFGDWCFKFAWIVIAAYILSRIGLGGVSIPTPF
jgi:DNA repair ATPase RecN